MGVISPLFLFLINKNKNMEPQMHHECPHCESKAQETKVNDEMGLAILIMLMPAMTLTVFSSMGLF